MTNKELLCELYLCQRYDLLSSDILSYFTEGECAANCENTDRNKEGCDKRIALRSGAQVKPYLICNDVCDLRQCEDEANCNGYMYGIYCKFNNKLRYIHPTWICNGNKECNDSEDEADCSVTNTTEMSCRQSWNGQLVPVHNFTRCLPIHDVANCMPEDIAKEHINCTDPSKVGLKCEIHGYPSTISKYLICYDDNITACDDGFQSKCLTTSSCRVHKHAMCDNKEDCVDLADENHPDCRSKTKATCKRRVGNMGELPIPIAWLKDGVRDCQNGTDETADWPTCGQGKTLRFVPSIETECENVFLCRTGNDGYVELHNLCDGLDTCGNENAICSVSSRSQSVTTSVLTTNKGLTKHFSYCLNGLNNLQQFISVCVKERYIYPDEEIFGVDTKTSLILPKVTTTCDNMFGEMYLYTSCTGRCVNAVCPLRTIPRYEVCPNQLPNRVGTLVNNEYLIFLTKSFGTIYTNNYFVCDDKIKCIEYSKVCDLVNDCQDNSDEAHCSNHFKCNFSGKLLPKTKQCDGQVDCFDLSDECNEHCSKQILEGTGLKGISWLIGLLAVMANLVIIGKSLWTLKRCRTVAAVLNRCLIIMIALGDFFIGCYLLIIAYYLPCEPIYRLSKTS